MSSDNKLEFFKVNADKPELILKKLMNSEKKRLSKKRKHSEMENDEESKIVEVEKESLQ